MTGKATAGPSLALIKYWGKASATENTPATTSLAVTLKELQTTTEACYDDRDSVVVNGREQPPERFASLLQSLRARLPLEPRGISVRSSNNFPTAAGLASSSSGFAAFVGAIQALSGASLSLEDLSSLARQGSGSATRSLFPGFTRFDAGASAAVPLFPESFWPEFRVVIAIIEEGAKPVSSRTAMEASRTTSPYYDAWLASSRELAPRAQDALAARDWNTLGPLIRQSYLRMFATMFTSDPPLLYWKPASLGILHTLEELRGQGLQAWETMDAGPQVKVFCPVNHVEPLIEELDRRTPGCRFLVASPGPGLRLAGDA